MYLLYYLWLWAKCRQSRKKACMWLGWAKANFPSLCSKCEKVLLTESHLSSCKMEDMREYLYNIHFHLGFLSQREDMLSLLAWCLCYYAHYLPNRHVAWMGSSSTHAWVKYMVFLEIKLFFCRKLFQHFHPYLRWSVTNITIILLSRFSVKRSHILNHFFLSDMITSCCKFPQA